MLARRTLGKNSTHWGKVPLRSKNKICLDKTLPYTALLKRYHKTTNNWYKSIILHRHTIQNRVFRVFWPLSVYWHKFWTKIVQKRLLINNRRCGVLADSDCFWLGSGISYTFAFRWREKRIKWMKVTDFVRRSWSVMSPCAVCFGVESSKKCQGHKCKSAYDANQRLATARHLF